MGEDGVIKNWQTGFQHFINGIGTLQGILQLFVPVQIFLKGLLYQIEDFWKVRFFSDTENMSRIRKFGEICRTGNQKIGMIIIADCPGDLTGWDQVDIFGKKSFSHLKNSYATETLRIRSGFYADIRKMIRQRV